MRAPTLLGILLAATLAGCLNAGTGPSPTPTPPPPYSQFRCADGNLHLGLSEDATRCNVRITGNAPGNNGPANELTIAVDPTNPLRLAAGAKDYTLGPDTDCGKYRVWSGYYWSADGGYTWGNDLMPGYDQPASSQSQSATAGYKCNSDPVIVWDDQGTVWYSGLAYAFTRVDASATPLGKPGLGNNLWMARSIDGGKTYGAAAVVAQGSDDAGVLHDKQWFTYDSKSKNFYLTWSMFVVLPGTLPPTPATTTTDQLQGTDQIQFTRSSDGVRWTPPRVLYESQARAGVLTPNPELEHQFSMPQVDADGRIYVTWRTEAGRSIWFTTSSNQGTTWTPSKAIVANIAFPCPPNVQCPPKNANFRVDTSPVLAVDRSDGPQRGTLYVVYAANTTQPVSNLDIFLVQSRDQGATWSAPARVNDDVGTNDQFMPWIDVGPKGDVHIVFYDRRYDAGNRLLDMTYVHSTDGVVFDPNIRMTEFSSDPALSYHQTGRQFIGDYLQVAEGANGWVHPIWVDTRAGRADVYTTVIVR